MKTMNLVIGVLTAIFIFGFTESQAAAHGSDMHVSSTGHEVTELQKTLQKLGYFHTEATGYYGSVTENAVKNFQYDFGIPATGYTGPLTRNKLEEIGMMARVVHGEARGESFNGQVAVAAVILNRIESAKFPGSAYGVIFQRHAFTAVSDNQYRLEPNASAYKAVREAFLGSDPSLGATYYYNPDHITNNWILSRPVIKRIGSHLFAK